MKKQLKSFYRVIPGIPVFKGPVSKLPYPVINNLVLHVVARTRWDFGDGSYVLGMSSTNSLVGDREESSVLRTTDRRIWAAIWAKFEYQLIVT